MFWINKTRAEKAAKIIAGYCNKQTNCDKCRFADENGELYVARKNSNGLGNSKGGPGMLEIVIVFVKAVGIALREYT